jgi:hypothetical protein
MSKTNSRRDDCSLSRRAFLQWALTSTSITAALSTSFRGGAWSHLAQGRSARSTTEFTNWGQGDLTFYELTRPYREYGLWGQENQSIIEGVAT